MFQRIMNLFRGFLGMFVSGVERRNPEALLEVEKENLRKQVGQFNQGLASHAALCERLMVQTKKLESEETELKAKTSANLRAGNREVAGQYALRLQTTSRELTENREQLKQAEETYKNLVKARDTAIAAAQAKIEALKNSINDLKVKRAMGELSEMASGMVTSIGGSGDTLDRLQTMVEEERQKAAGKARVAHDMLAATGDVNLKEAENNALAEQALADFAAQQGIALDPKAGKTPAASDTAEAAYKSMGPATEAQK
jgi:phage shock protein A